MKNRTRRQRVLQLDAAALSAPETGSCPMIVGLSDQSNAARPVCSAVEHSHEAADEELGEGAEHAND
jgi:hypothetical protein